MDRCRVTRFSSIRKGCLANVESERPAVSDWASALSWGRDEADLVHELQAGSETAFDWLVTHYHGPVYNLILGMLGDTSDAADGTQEVFLKAFRGIRALKEILEPLLGAQQIHANREQTSSHGNVSEAQPSPFGDAFSAARRFTFSSEGLTASQSDMKSPRASSPGEGLP